MAKQVKELRLRIPPSLYEALKDTSEKRMSSIGIFSRQMLAAGYKQFLETHPDDEYCVPDVDYDKL